VEGKSHVLEKGLEIAISYFCDIMFTGLEFVMQQQGFVPKMAQIPYCV
jgi:hypothetical protein